MATNYACKNVSATKRGRKRSCSLLERDFAYYVVYFVAAILSVFYGAGKPTLTMFDKVCLAGALASAALWWFTDNPLIALTLLMVIEMFGLIPTMEKTYRVPGSESAPAWV